jgi:hypothetical protein
VLQLAPSCPECPELNVSDPPNQLAKLQLSLPEERPPSPSEGTMRRREGPHPARLFSSRLDSAKMKVDIAPTATRNPTSAPFIEISRIRVYFAPHKATRCGHDWSPFVAAPFIDRSSGIWNFRTDRIASRLGIVRKGLP